ncbi:MAG TPA: hypothetical protein VGP72_15095 [Planctomycetota bacterium]|jgi:hypothetical protein
MERYRHTQAGWLIRVSLLVPVLAFVPLLIFLHGKGENIPLMIIAVVEAILILSLALFYSLTVSVSDDAVQLSFGIGIIRKRFALADIQDCHAVRNFWLYGWGIHLTPHGWLYNISGLDAVEIALSGGRHARIGTDEPEKLVMAIQESMNGR